MRPITTKMKILSLSLSLFPWLNMQHIQHLHKGVEEDWGSKACASSPLNKSKSRQNKNNKKQRKVKNHLSRIIPYSVMLAFELVQSIVLQPICHILRKYVLLWHRDTVLVSRTVWNDYVAIQYRDKTLKILLNIYIRLQFSTILDFLNCFAETFFTCLLTKILDFPDGRKFHLIIPASYCHLNICV